MTPAERLELFLDVAEQTEQCNREQRAEQRGDRIEDARDDPNYPTKADLAEMAYWDRLAERSGQAR